MSFEASFRLDSTDNDYFYELTDTCRYLKKYKDIIKFSDERLSNHGLKFIVLLLWVFIEPILLSTWGTTPGKWLFKISLRDRYGNKLHFLQAFKRSFLVWFKGLGLGIFSLITLIIACNNLEKNGITSWDRSGEFIVTHGKIGVLHTIVGIIFFIGYLMLVIN